MAEPAKPDISSSLNKEALLHAWAQLSVYDQTASQLKSRYIWRRRQVVIMTLIATTASVLTGIVGTDTLAVILGIIAVILPSIASAIMVDVVQFIGTTDWVRNRFVAEMIRMHIFLYRMRAGIYGKEPVWQADNRLGEQIDAIVKANKTENDVPFRIIQPKTEAEISGVIKQANSLTPDDNGLSEPSIENYVKWRLDLQCGWYEYRISADFRRFKFFSRFAQIFLLAGTLLGLLAGVISDAELVALIAVTNSISASLRLWSDLGLVGKTYGLFMVAANQLVAQKSRWIALKNDPEYLDPDRRAGVIDEFVQQIEKILEWERFEWREMALQAQVATDKIVLGDLGRLTSRAEAAQQEVQAP